MPEAKCPDDHELLPLAMGEPSVDHVQSHIESCRLCRRRVEQLRAEVSSLQVAETKRQESTPQDGTLLPPPVEAGGDTDPFGNTSWCIGRYRVIAKLSEGGQGIVYRAVHPTLPHELVVKLSRGPWRGDSAGKQRLVDEAKVLLELDHPNLARIYDLDFHEGRPFVVLQYIRGPNLRQYARQRNPSARETASIVAQLGRAIAVAHNQGVIHRDIKPDNVVIDEHGRPRLIDFGLAELSTAWTDEAAAPGIVGTPAYMPPEQASGATNAMDSRSDIFSLGALLYELLAGAPPFAAADTGESLKRARGCEFDHHALRKAAVPRRLKTICLRAMSPEPADRYVRADDMAADLERVAHKGLRKWLAVGAGLAIIVAALVLASAKYFTPLPRPQASLQELLRIHRDDGVFPLSKAVPVWSGTKIRILCTLPQEMKAAVFWFDSEGHLSELNQVQVSRAGSAYQLVCPVGMEQNLFTLVGPPGTEVAVVCGSSKELPSRSRLEPFFSDGPWPNLPPNVFVLASRDQVSVETAEGVAMTRSLGDAENDRVSAVEDRLNRLRQELAEQFEFVAGVAFAHAQ